MTTGARKIDLTPDAIRQGISNVRWSYVDSYVQRRVDHRRSEFDREDVQAWEQTAVSTWNERYPELHELWRAIDQGRVTIT